MTATVNVMANQNDVRRIAMALPGATESKDRFAFSVDNKGKPKGFVWVWLERIDPKKARVPQPNVLAVRVADQTEKAALLAADPETFFTEPHYDGYPAVLVRLPKITEAELRQVIIEAWRCLAPKPVVAAYDAGNSAPESESARPRKRKPTAKPSARSKSPGVPTAKPSAPSRPQRTRATTRKRR